MKHIRIVLFLCASVSGLLYSAANENIVDQYRSEIQDILTDTQLSSLQQQGRLRQLRRNIFDRAETHQPHSATYQGLMQLAREIQGLPAIRRAQRSWSLTSPQTQQTLGQTPSFSFQKELPRKKDNGKNNNQENKPQGI